MRLFLIMNKIKLTSMFRRTNPKRTLNNIGINCFSFIITLSACMITFPKAYQLFVGIDEK